jgi:hypothetical protein
MLMRSADFILRVDAPDTPQGRATMNGGIDYVGIR